MADRLQKVLAHLGYGSRRQIEDWTREGRIRINDGVATLGQQVSAEDSIFIDGKPVKQPLRPAEVKVLAYYKKAGQVCSNQDPYHDNTVFSHLPKVTGKWIMVGRLDINTSGLLLFTTDGEMAHRLMHPSFEVEREYAVRVLGTATPEQLNDLQQGVELADGRAQFNKITSAGGDGANHWYHVTLHEGRHREVRRLWQAVGLEVSRLIRVRYGSYALPRSLSRGNWSYLEPEQINTLRQQVGLSAIKYSKTTAGNRNKQAFDLQKRNAHRRRPPRRK